jgi:hypothetical protein
MIEVNNFNKYITNIRPVGSPGEKKRSTVFLFSLSVALNQFLQQAGMPAAWKKSLTRKDQLLNPGASGN